MINGSLGRVPALGVCTTTEVRGLASLPGCVMTPVCSHSALTPRYNVTSGILLSLSGPRFPPQLNERITWALELPPLPLSPLFLTPPSEPSFLFSAEQQPVPAGLQLWGPHLLPPVLIKTFLLGCPRQSQGPGLHSPSSGSPSSIPGRGTRSCVPQLEIPRPTTKTQCSQISI